MPTGNGQPRTYNLTDPADYTVGNRLNESQLQFALRNDPALAANIVDSINRVDNDILLNFPNVLSGAEEVQADSIVLAHNGKKTFSGFRYSENNPVQSTVLETYQNAHSFTLPPVGAGVYIISWQCEIRVVTTGPLNSAGDLRFRIAGGNNGVGHWLHEEWNTISGFDRVSFEEGEEPTIELQYRRDPTIGGNDTIEVRRVRLGVEGKG